MRRAVVVAIAVATLAPTAAAAPDDPLPRLPTRITGGGFRARLAMRQDTVATPTPPPTPKRPARRAPTRIAPIAVAPAARAQLSLGLAVDGAGLSGPTVAGQSYNASASRDYSPARAYTFGEAFLGTRGLVVPGISAYLASQFQLASANPTQVPLLRAWDRVDPFQIRTAWTEADGIFDRGLARTLRVRGGRQYVYGPAVAHIDGLSASWKTSRLRLGAYLGSRVPDWYYEKSRDREPRGLVTGGEVALVLRRGRAPLALRARGLIYGGATHSDFTLDWTARPDLVLAFTSRLADRKPAREHITARYRWSEETRVVIDADLRHRRDWLWDYELREASDPSSPRRYLDLGPRLPRVGLKVRAGTVLLDNIDLLVFGGFAFDSRGDDVTPSFTAAGWVEGGGALEVRMRRTFALVFSGLSRFYNRRDAPLAERILDVEDGAAQPLTWPTANVGERGLVEGGVVAKFLGGARRFNISGEIYARRTTYAQLYEDDGVGPINESILDPIELHGGGRFVLEAWVTPAIRIRTEYDLSNRLSIASETDGLKSLRVIAEGRY